MQDPEIVFSHWVRWAERTSLKDIHSPGVYLLAHLDTVPIGPADPQAEQIIYIGETCDNLRDRWWQFNYSAFEGKFGHSGGTTYWQTFGGQGNNLHVTAFPVKEFGDKIRPLFIRHIERKLIWEFVQKWDRAPTCNRK